MIRTSSEPPPGTPRWLAAALSSITVLGGLLLLPAKSVAQLPYQVIDLDPRRLGQQSSEPRDFATVDGLTYFEADSGASGRELWVTDGTAAGTRLLLDVGQGAQGTSARALGKLGDHTLLAAGGTVWTSQGTPETTVALRRATGITRESSTSFAFADDYAVFYQPNPERTQSEIWRTDGTVEGTWVLATAPEEIRFVSRGQDVAMLDCVGGFWITDGTVEGTNRLTTLQLFDSVTTAADHYFLAVSGFDEDQIWVSDGQTVEQLSDGQGVVNGRVLSPVDTALYFNSDSDGNTRVWRTDGSPEGTQPIGAPGIELGASSRGERVYTELGRHLVSVGSIAGEFEHKLYSIDLATGETVLLEPEIQPQVMVGLGDRAIFEATRLFDARSMLWVTDGTPEGTFELLGPCDPQACPSQSIYHLVPGGDGALFARITPSEGVELWTTDGTELGTRPLTDFPDPEALPDNFGNEGWLSWDGERAWLAATGDSRGEEPWVLDSTFDSPRLLADVAPPRPASSLDEWVALGDRLVFSACNGEQVELWSTRGSPGDTVMIHRFEASANCAPAIEHLTAADGRVYFALADGELWTSDTTPQGTRRLLDAAGAGLTLVEPVVSVGSRLLFAADDGDTLGFWASDGTAAGTVAVEALAAPSSEVVRVAAVPAGDVALVAYEDFGFLGRIFYTDGTPGGTVLVAELGIFLDPSDPLEVVAGTDGTLFFNPRTSPLGIWRTDGTAEGTFLAVDTRAITTFGHPVNLAPYADRLVFTIEDGFDTAGLYLVDPEAGEEPTELVGFDWFTSRSLSGFIEPTALGGRLFFVLADSEEGEELWVSDGTAGGTELFGPRRSGAAGLQPRRLSVWEDRLYFAASDSAGEELWVSDGTVAGTRRIDDIAPGAPGSSPEGFVAAGDRLYFAADDQQGSGRELWAVGRETSCSPGPATLCLGDGRFRATLEWADFSGSGGRGQAVPLRDDTGAFWFFDADNLEAMVKVIDGRGTNGHFWVFYGSLTNVGFELTVEDLVTGQSKTYQNPAGSFASAGDIFALPAPDGLGLAGSPGLEDRAVAIVDPAKGGCTSSDETLCLAGGRFRLAVDWTDFEGRQGSGNAEPLTDDTGAFWFFGPSNLELMVKVIDGRDFNGKYWVFYGALSNVAFELTIEDTTTGASVTYSNPLGTFASRGDIDALPGGS